MQAQTLYEKLWSSHVVHVEDDGTALIYIDRHLVHEVTSPQAFEGLREAGRKVWRTSSIVATADHNTPTTGWERGYDGIADPISKEQITTLDKNIAASGAAAFFPFLHKRQGIVHVIGPENGATLPGMTVVCGDSHTSTHGAFGGDVIQVVVAIKARAGQRNKQLPWLDGTAVDADTGEAGVGVDQARIQSAGQLAEGHGLKHVVPPRLQVPCRLRSFLRRCRRSGPRRCRR